MSLAELIVEWSDHLRASIQLTTNLGMGSLREVVLRAGESPDCWLDGELRAAVLELYEAGRERKLDDGADHPHGRTDAQARGLRQAARDRRASSLGRSATS